MARSYSRDSRGRFSGGGGGGGKSGGSKAASTRAKNTARAAELKAKGTGTLGSRVKAKGFSGGKAAQKRAGGLRANASGGMKAAARPNTVNARGKQSGAQKSATTAANKAKARTASKAAQRGNKPAKTDKAPANAAKARFKQLSGAARKSSPMRTAAENRKAAGAKRSLKSMIAKRGRK
jgi:hypothetical protein